MPAEKRPSRKAAPEKPPAPEPVVAPPEGANGTFEAQDETVMGEGLGPAPADEKQGRAKRKKKEMPEGLWLKCESCGAMIYRKELEEKGMVCPACDFHFTLPGKARIAMLVDPGTWAEKFAELGALDRLEFTDSVLRFVQLVSVRRVRRLRRGALSDSERQSIWRISRRPVHIVAP